MVPGSGRSGSTGLQLQLRGGNELGMVSEDQAPHRVGGAHEEFKRSFLLTWELRDTLRSVQRMRSTSETRTGRAWAGEG